MDTTSEIFYATGSGNSRRLSETLQEEISELSFNFGLSDLSGTTAASLAGVHFAVFFVSTWGEGDPPPGSESFFETLDRFEGSLDHLRYAVVGLGDSCFTNFCGAGVKLDAHLRRLGATAVMPLRKLDAYFAPCFRQWKTDFTELLLRNSPSTRFHQTT